MADYGLKIFDSSGVCTLDLTDTITRLRYSAEISSDGQVELSDISGKNTVEFSISLTTGSMQPLVGRTNNTIYWEYISGSGSSCLLLVFLYD